MGGSEEENPCPSRELNRSLTDRTSFFWLSYLGTHYKPIAIEIVSSVLI
jgi:hypothetical protein